MVGAPETGTTALGQPESWRSRVGRISKKVAKDPAGYTSLICLHSQHWPLEVFPPGALPNPTFNRNIDLALGTAVRHDFRGQSGKHLADRLTHKPSNQLKSKIDTARRNLP